MSLDQASQETSDKPNMWWVSNGDETVGPIDTNLLLRGVSAGRVPENCWVFEQRWSGWRRLEQVREVNALQRGDEGGQTEPDFARLLRQATDRNEVLLLGLYAARDITHARFGLVQRLEEGALRTVCAYGPSAPTQLGCVIEASDPSLATVRNGEVWLGRPSDPHAATAAERLGSGKRTVDGVALIPIRSGGELIALLELGRSDHPFRASDAPRLARLANVIADAWDTWWT
jgi:hypothetical protein